MSINPTRLVSRKINVREERVKGSTSGAHYADLAARAKGNSPISPYCVPNEFICQKLGEHLLLPVAQGIVIANERNSPDFLYAAVDFSQDGEPFPPVVPEACVQVLPELCAAIVLFDIFIANSDRSQNNLYFNADLQNPEMMIFDHEAALLGTTPRQAEGHLTGGARNRLGIPNHCLKKLVSFPTLTKSVWVERIKTIPEYFIDGICREAAQYGITDLETEALIVFLSERRGKLLGLIQSHETEFGS